MQINKRNIRIALVIIFSILNLIELGSALIPFDRPDLAGYDNISFSPAKLVWGVIIQALLLIVAFYRQSDEEKNQKTNWPVIIITLIFFMFLLIQLQKFFTIFYY